MDELINELVADLTIELQLTDENFNATLLKSKVTNAIREIKLARKYPTTYTDTMIATDMANYYSNARELALYDYNTIGAEFQASSSENSVSRNWVDRNTLFYGIIPLTKGVSE